MEKNITKDTQNQKRKENSTNEKIFGLERMA